MAVYKVQVTDGWAKETATGWQMPSVAEEKEFRSYAEARLYYKLARDEGRGAVRFYRDGVQRIFKS